MTIKVLLTAAVVALTASPTTYIRAQEKEETAQKTNVNIGSHVLKQVGESEYSYKNEAYTYRKVWEVPNATKAQIYDRTMVWLKNVSGAVVSDIATDEEKNTLGATFTIELADRAIQHQTVTFRFVFSFKDNKIKLEGDDYKYYGDWDNGYKTRQVATSYGMRNETYRDAGEYRKDFHNLRPMTKGTMRNIYEDFDERYLKLVRSMKAKVIQKDNDNW